MADNQKGKSPYVKYGKKPYRYSELYQNWKAARARGDTAQAAILSEQHKARFLGVILKEAAE